MLTTDSRDEKEEKKIKESKESLTSEDTSAKELTNPEAAENLDIKNLHTKPFRMKTITRLTYQQSEDLVRYVSLT